MPTLQLQSYHSSIVFQSFNHLTLVSPIILQGEICDDQGGVIVTASLQKHSTLISTVGLLVIAHGNEDVHLPEVIRSQLGPLDADFVDS